MKRLVLVEDDSLIAETLRITLSYRGFATEVVGGVRAAMKVMERNTYDIAVVDVALPDGDGFELCRNIRRTDPHLPILMLTARVDETSAVTGIDSGADDYVRKPCGLEELTARLNRLLGRGSRNRSIKFRSLRIDPEERTAHAGKTQLQLRRREYEILHLLMKHAGEIVTREQVLKSIDEELAIFDRSIDSHICRLRGKLRNARLDDARIVSIYGIGYRLEEA